MSAVTCPGPNCPPTTSNGKCPLHYKPKTVAERKRESRLRQRIVNNENVKAKEAERKREYRKRKQLQDVSNVQIKRSKTPLERQRECRKRKLQITERVELNELVLQLYNPEDIARNATIYKLANEEFAKRFYS
ncbi:hypothetical protein PGB90_007014 [Kerria lacca]